MKFIYKICVTARSLVTRGKNIPEVYYTKNLFKHWFFEVSLDFMDRSYVV